MRLRRLSKASLAHYTFPNSTFSELTNKSKSVVVFGVKAYFPPVFFLSLFQSDSLRD